MYCQTCGNAIPDTASFCPSCGKGINATVKPKNKGNSFLRGAGYVLLLFVAGYDLILGVTIIYPFYGIGGVAFGLFAFPVLLLLTPIFSLILFGAWFPIFFVYCGGALAWFMLAKGVPEE